MKISEMRCKWRIDDLNEQSLRLEENEHCISIVNFIKRFVNLNRLEFLIL